MKTSLTVLAAFTLIVTFVGPVANAGTVEFSCYVPHQAMATGDDAPSNTTADLCLDSGLEKLTNAGCEVDPASALPELKLDGYFKEFRLIVTSKNCSTETTGSVASTDAKVAVVAPECAIATTPLVIERDRNPVGPIFKPFTNHICVDAQ